MLFSTSHVSNAFAKLCDAAAECREELSNYCENSLFVESEDEAGSNTSRVDWLVETERTRPVLKMNNFSVRESSRLYNRFHEFIVTHWISKRGKTSRHKPKDVLFMMLTVQNFGFHWDILARTSHIKMSTFGQLIHNFVGAFHKHIYENCVVEFTSSYTVTKLRLTSNAFKNFPYACHSTDVYKISESAQKKDYFLSGKHKLYGMKIEDFFFPDNCSTLCSPHYPGWKLIILIMHNVVMNNKNALQKKYKEAGNTDLIVGISRFSGSWNSLFYKSTKKIMSF